MFLYYVIIIIFVLFVIFILISIIFCILLLINIILWNFKNIKSPYFNIFNPRK